MDGLLMHLNRAVASSGRYRRQGSHDYAKRRFRQRFFREGWGFISTTKPQPQPQTCTIDVDGEELR